MLLRTKIRTMFGQGIILPEIGEVKINEEGIIQVEDTIASLLLDGDNWEQVEQPKKDDEDDEEKDEEDVDDSELSSKLDSMSLEDMLLLAKDANLKGFNLFSKDASKMRIFLKKKLQ